VAERLELIVDGLPLSTLVEPGRTLLRVLRDDLGRTGTKEGCDDSDR
jgi:aerobic-type carbon monoxide dehydrogenase small subunit (CoxS/CutS family)